MLTHISLRGCSLSAFLDLMREAQAYREDKNKVHEPNGPSCRLPAPELCRPVSSDLLKVAAQCWRQLVDEDRAAPRANVSAEM